MIISKNWLVWRGLTLSKALFISSSKLTRLLYSFNINHCTLLLSDQKHQLLLYTRLSPGLKRLIIQLSILTFLPIPRFTITTYFRLWFRYMDFFSIVKVGENETIEAHRLTKVCKHHMIDSSYVNSIRCDWID